jgi:hypothetical protein
MAKVSESFLGKPYVADPLGEGAKARFDRDPRLRLDGFDCTTFIETVLAISKSRRSQDVGSMMDRIRYKRGNVSFETRNHFTGVDWIANNSRAGYVRDITIEVAGSNARLAEALIEKDEWYRHLSADRLSGVEESMKGKRLEELRALSRNHGKSLESMPYIPKETIDKNPELLEKIPQGSIINIVRPNWDLTKQIGTHMNVSHQGLAIHKGGVVYFRHASSSKNVLKVVEVPLVDYVRGTLASPTIGGINVLQVR